MSLFLSAGERRFPVPLIACEYLRGEVNQLSARGVLDDDTALHVHLEALRRFCGVAVPTQEDLDYLVQRLSEPVEQSFPAAPGPTSRAPQRERAWAKFLKALDTENLLLAATGYDVERARRLFCSEDLTVALRVVELWMRETTARFDATFEAVLFGSGNSYADGAGEADGAAIDPDSAEGYAYLKGLFSRH